jgi:CheY-like chemotaxis protein
VPSETALSAAVPPWDDPSGVASPSGPSAATVLVVDDNADMRGYLTRLLTPHWTVRTANDGREALAAIAAARPDVVVTDVMMPQLDGFELLRALKRDPATSGVPVLMLTARAGQEAAVEGFAAGVDDYLAKPFEGPELVARVRVAVQRAGGTAPGPVVSAPRPPAPAARPAAPVVPGPRAVPPSVPAARAAWRFASSPRSMPVLRRRLGAFLADAGLDEDAAYDLVLAACEAATNAVEHAQQPTEPFIDVTVEAGSTGVQIAVRDYGQWRERVPSMDRGRGSALMSAVGEIVAVPSAAGTTVVIRAAA